MIATAKKIPLPSEDKRWRIVDATMRRNGYDAHALIETLHTVQECFGFIDDDAMKFVARALRCPLSKVYGVATFYHFFSLKPAGRHTCVVCMGTACYIKGAPKIVGELERVYDVKAGETTADGRLSVVQARCLGSCGLAPAVVFDGQVAGRITVEQTMQRVAALVETDAPVSTGAQP